MQEASKRAYSTLVVPNLRRGQVCFMDAMIPEKDLEVGLNVHCGQEADTGGQLRHTYACVKRVLVEEVNIIVNYIVTSYNSTHRPNVVL